MKFKVTFHLDGSGLIYDINEPLHLDALLAWVLAPRQKIHQHLGRDDIPEGVKLPLMRETIGKHWVYKASALLPEGFIGEDLQHWRKRFRTNKSDVTNGSPNLTNGTYRDWNNPLPLVLVRNMIAYADGNRSEVKKLFKEVKYLGKKRAHGHGKILDISFDEVQDDFTLIKDGKSMRWMPDVNGTRIVRMQPPYWNRHDRIYACDVGDEYDLCSAKA